MSKEPQPPELLFLLDRHEILAYTREGYVGQVVYISRMKSWSVYASLLNLRQCGFKDDATAKQTLYEAWILAGQPSFPKHQLSESDLLKAIPYTGAPQGDRQ